MAIIDILIFENERLGEDAGRYAIDGFIAFDEQRENIHISIKMKIFGQAETIIDLRYAGRHDAVLRWYDFDIEAISRAALCVVTSVIGGWSPEIDHCYEKAFKNNVDKPLKERIRLMVECMGSKKKELLDKVAQAVIECGLDL